MTNFLCSFVQQAGRFSGRTRGCRVNYTSAFKDASDSEDEASYQRQNGSSTDNRAYRGPLAASLNRLVIVDFTNCLPVLRVLLHAA